MEFFVGVENFGKISSAKINVGDYTVFVGNNNSGKTYIMQLIYGVLEKIPMIDINLDEEVSHNIRKNNENSVVSYLNIDKNIMKLLEQKYNDYFEKNKEELIREIFHDDIPIQKLYVEFAENYNEDYVMSFYEINEAGKFVDEVENSNNENRIETQEIKKVYNILKYRESFSSIRCLSKEGDPIIISFWNDNKHDIFNRPVIVNILNIPQSLFIPASRTGLFLLYRDFFAIKVDDNIIFNKEKSDSNSLGLTAPVYNFLRFLQTYKINQENSKKNLSILDFIEDRILEGKIDFDKSGEAYYMPKNSSKHIPLYLSSSMINELAPIVYALTSNENPDLLIYDEIETSLHPSKQVEMARLLNRLCNDGKKIIISTHSDTMATKINNLLLISHADLENPENLEKLKSLELEQEDLLIGKEVNVYQFKNIGNGQSVVEPIDYERGIGYEFDMFTDSVIRLYNESKIITEFE